jgi:hypothetical protein
MYSKSEKIAISLHEDEHNNILVNSSVNDEITGGKK